MLTEDQLFLINKMQDNIEDLEIGASKIRDAYDHIKYQANILNHNLEKLKDPSYILPWEKPEALEAKKQYKSLGTLLGKTSC